VNVDFSGSASFNSVVATTSNPAFEFNSVAYAATPVPITPAAVAAAGNLGQTNVIVVDPAPMLLPGASPLGAAILAGSALWRRRRKGPVGRARFYVRRPRGFRFGVAHNPGL
jgi:MYXO-CTERM domain-containing protein